MRCIESPKRSIWKLPNIVREHYYSFSLPPAEHYYSSTALALKGFVVLGERNKLPSSDMGARLSPLLRVPPKLPHRKYFRRGPRPFPPKGPHGFRGHLTRLTLCVAIAIPSVRRDAIGAARSNRWTFGSQLKARVYLDLRRCDAINATRNDRWTFGSALT